MHQSTLRPPFRVEPVGLFAVLDKDRRLVVSYNTQWQAEEAAQKLTEAAEAVLESTAVETEGA